MNSKKFFKVTKIARPEWGKDRIEFVKYFEASSEETVRAVVRERYGVNRYFACDREEVVYEFEELQFETL